MNPQTPIPWSVRISPKPLNATVISAPAGTVAVCYAVYDQDASFLITAVNSHAELLAACNRAKAVLEDYVHGDPADVPEMCAMAETLEDCIAAIANAGGNFPAIEKAGAQ